MIAVSVGEVPKLSRNRSSGTCGEHLLTQVASRRETLRKNRANRMRPRYNLKRMQISPTSTEPLTGSFCQVCNAFAAILLGPGEYSRDFQLGSRRRALLLSSTLAMQSASSQTLLLLNSLVAVEPTAWAVTQPGCCRTHSLGRDRACNLPALQRS